MTRKRRSDFRLPLAVARSDERVSLVSLPVIVCRPRYMTVTVFNHQHILFGKRQGLFYWSFNNAIFAAKHVVGLFHY